MVVITVAGGGDVGHEATTTTTSSSVGGDDTQELLSQDFGESEVRGLGATYIRAMSVGDTDGAVTAIDALKRALLRLEEERHRRYVHVNVFDICVLLYSAASPSAIAIAFTTAALPTIIAFEKTDNHRKTQTRT